MEKSILVIMALLMTTGVFAQGSSREMEVQEGDTTYTMKRYVFCMYLSGPERDQSEEEVAKIQSAHLSHLGSLEETHGLIVAGPFDDDSDKRGLMIFDLETTKEAEEALENDPAVKAGRLIYECHPWWGAKGSELK